MHLKNAFQKFANPYRYGFNGKENDNEVKGTGNQQDYGMRIYDPRLGRFLSVDPIAKDYPELTPYQFGSLNPIMNIDIDGLEGLPANRTAFVYYVGGDNFDGFGLGGHTAGGYYDPKNVNKTTSYGAFSGHSGETEQRVGSDGNKYTGYSEGLTIKHYLDDNEIVQRIHHIVTENAGDYIEGALENNAINNKDGEGTWCTCQVRNMYNEAFKYEGYPDKIAGWKADKIVPNTLPEELSDSEVLESGSVRYDKFYKKDDKYYHDKNIYNAKTKEWGTTTTEIKDFETYFSTQESNQKE